MGQYAWSLATVLAIAGLYRVTSAALSLVLKTTRGDWKCLEPNIFPCAIREEGDARRTMIIDPIGELCSRAGEFSIYVSGAVGMLRAKRWAQAALLVSLLVLSIGLVALDAAFVFAGSSRLNSHESVSTMNLLTFGVRALATSKDVNIAGLCALHDSTKVSPDGVTLNVQSLCLESIDPGIPDRLANVEVNSSARIDLLTVLASTGNGEADFFLITGAQIDGGSLSQMRRPIALRMSFSAKIDNSPGLLRIEGSGGLDQRGMDNIGTLLQVVEKDCEVLSRSVGEGRVGFFADCIGRSSDRNIIASVQSAIVNSVGLSRREIKTVDGSTVSRRSVSSGVKLVPEIKKTWRIAIILFASLGVLLTTLDVCIGPVDLVYIVTAIRDEIRGEGNSSDIATTRNLFETMEETVTNDGKVNHVGFLTSNSRGP